MDAFSVSMGVCGLLLAALALRVQVVSYRLQRTNGNGPPGTQLDPREAIEVLEEEVADDAVKAIAADHIFVSPEERGVGYIKKRPIRVYLDLHSASCHPMKREILATALANFLQEEMGETARRFLIATPREGNLLIGADVAEAIGTDYLMIRTAVAPRFGYPIEGSFVPGSTAIIVDDLIMEGDFLQRCVKSLRRYGLNVSHCFCLFERLDGDARESLDQVSVKLHSKYQIEDEMLEALQSGAEST